MTVPGFKGCTHCGNCCRIEGDVRLRRGEAEQIAAFLDMSIYDFTAEHTRVTADRVTLSLTEQPAGACIFLEDDRCVIDTVKPQQCRGFPHVWCFDGWEDICEGFAEERP